jgi:hypothetical protein
MLCIWMPTCIMVTKELLTESLKYNAKIKRFHLIADEKIKMERLLKRWLDSAEINVRLKNWDTHNKEYEADKNIDTWKILIPDIVRIICQEIYSIM